ncbi:MAG: DUF503 domain-containing protein [Firmicutes bacterium]|nr:DUF503 domain-containing protein [Bacillota bacterium]
MVVGVLTVDLFLGEAASLKDKRRVLKSVIDRIRSRFNVSVAEVDGQDAWQRSTVGVSFVSCDQAHVHKVLASVVRFIEAQGSVVITGYRTELL